MEPHFKLSREQVRELDRRAIEEFGVPGIVLMENAGQGCAHLIMAIAGEEFHEEIDAGIPIVICCGKGNNGGDGFVIARHLQACYDVDVRVLLFANPADLRGDAAVNYTIVQRSGIPVFTAPADVPTEWLEEHFGFEGGIVVDALFGTGLTGPITEPLARVVNAINDCEPMRFAVDIPSGLDCDTGLSLGPTVRATHTATFVANKKGFYNRKSREWTGEIHIVDIGAPRVLVDEYRKRGDA